MPTTFILLAIDHDPAIRPELWDWAALADHPDPGGVVAAATVDDEPAAGRPRPGGAGMSGPAGADVDELLTWRHATASGTAGWRQVRWTSRCARPPGTASRRSAACSGSHWRTSAAARTAGSPPGPQWPTAAH